MADIGRLERELSTTGYKRVVGERLSDGTFKDWGGIPNGTQIIKYDSFVAPEFGKAEWIYFMYNPAVIMAASFAANDKKVLTEIGRNFSEPCYEVTRGTFTDGRDNPERLIAYARKTSLKR